MNGILQTKKPLDSRQLNAFVILMQTGSLAETARHLYLTQSAISHSIRALEIEAGCRLLAKVGKSIVSTQAVEALLHHAELGLKELAEGRRKLEKLKTWGTASTSGNDLSAMHPIPCGRRLFLVRDRNARRAIARLRRALKS